MRIAIVISGLECGGAPRAVSVLANSWAEAGHQVMILGIHHAPEISFFALHSEINYATVAVLPRTTSGFARFIGYFQGFFRLRAEILRHRSDVVISFLDYINVITLISTLGLPMPVIVSERTSAGASQTKIAWKVLRTILYQRAAAIVAVAKGGFGAPSFRKRQLRTVIPGPFMTPPEGAVPASKTEPRIPMVVSLGRLSPEKQFPVLMKTFDRAATLHPTWILSIWGDGPCMNELVLLRNQLDSRERIRLPGSTADSFAMLRTADIFVLTSQYEGFPHALYEAMCCGLAVVAFDCSVAIRELITDGENGIIIPANNQERLTVAVESLMRDDFQRASLGLKARKVSEVYSLSNTMRSWNSVIDSCINRT